MWWLAGGVTAFVVVGVLAAVGYFLAGRKVWTDDRGIRRPDADASLRFVLWTDPAALDESLNTPEQEYEPSESPDGRMLFFVRGLPGKGADIYVSVRDDAVWSRPAPLAAVNGEHDDLGPRMTPDGRFLMFYSNRPGGQGQYDIWAAPRTEAGWGEPFNLGPAVNSKYNDYGPAMDPAGERLYFATNRKAAERDEQRVWKATIRQGDLGDYDLFVAEVAAPSTQPAPASRPAPPPDAPERPSGRLKFAEARELEGVNTRHHEGASCISPGGDFLYFASNRPGGLGGFDLYRCRLRDGRCGDVVNLGGEINTGANEADPQLGMGGFQMYFSSDRSESRGQYDLFVAESHEVYAARGRRELPDLGWSMWALLIALIALVPLLLFLRAAGYEHLSLLKKCIAVSLLAHILLTVLLSVWKISTAFLEYLAEEAGMTVAVNLDIGREVETKLQVRRQISELPVADRSLTLLSRVRPAVERPVPPRPAELNVPKIPVRPSSMTVRPEAPPKLPPVLSDRISIPAPRVAAVAPRIEFSPPERIAFAEETPQPRPPSPLDMVVRRLAPSPVQPTPRLVRVAPKPARQPESSPAEPMAEPAPAPKPLPTTGDVKPQARKVPLKIPPMAPGVQIRLPGVPTADRREEQRPEPSGPRRPDPLRRRIISVFEETRRSEERLPGQVPPAEKQAESLAGRTVAAVRRPGADDVPTDEITPRAMLVPLPDLLTPGRLTAPESLFQRSFEQRQKLIDKAGGSKESEQAVAMALVYLSRNQEEDGRWTLVKDKGRTKTKERRKPRESGSRRNEVDLAVTGLAALSFLAADHTPAKPGPYQETITRALAYLLKIQKPDGDLRGGGGRMYGQAMATLALAEAAAMTGDKACEQAAIKGAQFIVRAQNRKTGGWRYTPGDPGDTSVLGWQVMALHSAQRLGMRIPDETRQGAIRWLNMVGSGKQRMLAGYTGRSPTPPMTAEAVFSRMLLGQEFNKAQEDEACNYLLANLPGKPGRGRERKNFYYLYYASLMFRHMQNDAWDRWNVPMREHLIATQRTSGDAAGSWDTDSQWGARGGRIYTTAMAALTLEVYYRYLPMYRPASKRAVSE